MSTPTEPARRITPEDPPQFPCELALDYKGPWHSYDSAEPIEQILRCGVFKYWRPTARPDAPAPQGTPSDETLAREALDRAFDFDGSLDRPWHVIREDILTALRQSKAAPAREPDLRSCTICGFTVDLNKGHVAPEGWTTAGRTKK